MHKETLNNETEKVFNLIKEIAQDFYLAGGTALALQLGHRVSVDLDFFTTENFIAQDILLQLSTKGSLEIDSQSENTINGTINGVKISFFKLPFKLLFQTQDFLGVKIADERDIAAMKILAISGRGSKKDFVDLFFLLKKYSLKEILDFFYEKYSNFNYNNMHILKSLTYFEDADTDGEPIYIFPTKWEEVKSKIQKEVKDYLDKYLI